MRPVPQMTATHVGSRRDLPGDECIDPATWSDSRQTRSTRVGSEQLIFAGT
jgi:hypothetical protein